MNWKKWLKVAGIGALGALLHMGKDSTVGQGETSDTIGTAVLAALAGAISTDGKKKDS